MFEYITTCTDPSITDFTYLYTEECKEIIETYYESI